MAETPIKIVRRGNRIEPESGFRVRVGNQDVVTFTTDPGVVGLSITFLDDSPFGAGKQTVPYKTRLPIAVAIDPPAKSKVFRFRCEIEVDGQRLVGGEPAGGEMEVIRPGSN